MGRHHPPAAHRQGRPETDPVPAPTLCNSPGVVATGAMASPALCAALEHEPAYPAKSIDCPTQETDVDENEAASISEGQAAEAEDRPLKRPFWTRTKHASPMSTPLSAASPAGSSKTDACAEENQDETLHFALPRPRGGGAVTIDHQPADGSATPAVDYEPASGTLAFVAAERTKDGQRDPARRHAPAESEETPTLPLSNALGSPVDEPTGTNRESEADTGGPAGALPAGDGHGRAARSSTSTTG